MGEFAASSSRWRLGLVTLGAAGFVGLGLWMGGAFGPVHATVRHSQTYIFVLGWISVLFFGWCGLIGIRRFIDNAVQLEIGALGIRWFPWSDQIIPWSEITDVTTWTYKTQKMIVLHLRDVRRFPGNGRHALLSGLNHKLTGGDIVITLTGTNRSYDEAIQTIARFRN
jgi:hypothetical protein